MLYAERSLHFIINIIIITCGAFVHPHGVIVIIDIRIIIMNNSNCKSKNIDKLLLNKNKMLELKQIYFDFVRYHTRIKVHSFKGVWMW